MTNRDLVGRFYAELWDRWDKAVAWEILAGDFLFRGSLGAERTGIEGFLDYVDQVRGALGGYRSDMGEMVDHQAELFGVPPTGRRISWNGAAFFGFRNGRISSLWVLGDVDAVKNQLGIAQGSFEGN